MHFTFRQFPYQPGINSAKSQFATCGSVPCSFYLVQYPFDLCAREVGVDNETGILAHIVGETFGFKFFADKCSSLVLPYNGVVNRLTCFSIPDYRGLTLIGDSNCSNRRSTYFIIAYYFTKHFQLCIPYLIRIVLYPTRLRKELGELFLCDTYDLSGFIKQNSTRTGSTLIK